ncbi:PH domain-containing protein [Paenibacillus sp. CAU 1782]
MNKERRLHPLYMVYGLLSAVKGFLPLIFIGIFNGFNWSRLLEWYWLAGISGVVVLILFFSYMEWRTTIFWLQEDRMIIRKGYLFREEKTLYYSRIHSVNVEQPLIQRLLGIAQLKIETPGGGKKADGVLQALSLKEAGVIKDQLRQFADEVKGAGSKAAADSERIRPVPESGMPSASGAMESLENGTPSTSGAMESLESGMPSASGAMESLENGTPSTSGAMESLNNGTPSPVASAKSSDRGGPAWNSSLRIGEAEHPGQRAAGSSSAGQHSQSSKRQERVIGLGPGKLFQAAATSLNFGLALAFLAGIYSFADDFIKLLVPDHFVEQVVEDSAQLLSGVLMITVVALLVLVFAWVLSIVLYVLKYSGFRIARESDQVTLSYGLLEKKMVVFNPRNVQAVIVGESLLRQWLGYGEVKLQVVTSEKQEMLMLHPYIKLSEIQQLLDGFIPGFHMGSGQKLQPPPRRALLYYIRIPLLLAVMASAAFIIVFGAVGSWSLLLIPLVAAWRFFCHRSAGVLLANRQLSLRRRWLNRSTYLIVRPRIVALKVSRSRGQRRRELASLSVYALGSTMNFGVSCLERADVENVWNWYSRSRT